MMVVYVQRGEIKDTDEESEMFSVLIISPPPQNKTLKHS